VQASFATIFRWNLLINEPVGIAVIRRHRTECERSVVRTGLCPMAIIIVTITGITIISINIAIKSLNDEKILRRYGNDPYTYLNRSISTCIRIDKL
jgi:hypothetical protein